MHARFGARACVSVRARACTLTASTDPKHAKLLLWAGTLGLGAGCSSSLPCAITLPAEARVTLSPVRLLVLNLCGSAGEMLMPFLIGAAFERGRYGALGVSLISLCVCTIVSTVIAWRVAAGARQEHEDGETEALQPLMDDSASAGEVSGDASA